MANTLNSNAIKPKTPFYKTKWFITIVVILVLFILYKVTHRAKSPYQFIAVTSGPISETVSVTGNTTPTQSVSLGFQNSGTIASVQYDVGAQVYAGAVIASLNTSDLQASLKQAQATVDAQNAKLQGLEAGSTPQNIAVSQAALSSAQQSLANMYSSISDTSIDSYSKANDAVQVQLAPLFTNMQSANPQLSFQTSDSQMANNAAFSLEDVQNALVAWQTSLTNINASSSSSDLTTLLSNNLTTLTSVRTLLNSVSAALNSAVANTQTITTYKANVTIAMNEVNVATKNLNTLSQNISSQKLLIAQSQAALSLTQAGATATDIAAQQAEVEQAEAGVLSAQAALQNSEIIAPITGVLTQQDAKVGQLATPGTPLVSIIGQSGFEVDAGVSETDIGKLAIGNKVSMTLDAFPNETFTGSVFYIAPAQTNTNGVISYQIKIAFDKADARLKSGLTANINVETKHKDSVLVLPQYAILQNDTGSFVETLSGSTITKVPVTLGIQDQNGNVEVLSGVTLGEQVINIGLKS